jgi:hypothetical protein
MWPDEDAVFLEIYEKVTISQREDSLFMHSEKRQEKLILTPLGITMNTDEVSHSDFFKLVNLEAATFIPQKKGFKKVEVDDFTTKDVLSGSVFHDDVKETSFLYPGLTEGSKAYLEYTEEVADVRFFPPTYFISYLPVNKMVFEIEFPASVDVFVQKQNMDRIEYHFTEELVGDKVIWRWEADSLPVIKIHPSAPNIRYYAPHLLPRVRFFEHNGETVQVLEYVYDLYQWYSGWIDSINLEDEVEEIQMVLDSILEPGMTDIEIVEAGYVWVQDNIKYIAMEAGYEGFIPREAAVVCRRRYGDCKDMTSLLTQMIRQAGVEEVYPVWIGTRDIPYSYYDVPSPLSDNHMVAVYIPEGGETIILDATSEHLPFGYPSGFIQGKEGLVAIEPYNEFKVITIPVMSSEKNHLVDSVFVEIHSDSLVGSGLRSATGYFRSFWETQLSDRTGERLIQFLRSDLQKGSNKFTLKDAEVLESGKRSEALQVKYDFAIPDFVIDVGDELFVNLNLETPFKNSEWEVDRDVPIEFRHTSEREFVVSLAIPSGYELAALPSEFKYDGKNLFFSTIYEQADEVITLRTLVKLKNTLIPSREVPEWNDAIKEFSPAYLQVLSLKKTK